MILGKDLVCLLSAHCSSCPDIRSCIYSGDIKLKSSALRMTGFIDCLTGVITQGQAVGPMQPVARMGAGMQFGPPLLGLHPATPQLLQGFTHVHICYK